MKYRTRLVFSTFILSVLIVQPILSAIVSSQGQTQLEQVIQDRPGPILTATSEDYIPVIISFPRPVTPTDIANFEFAGGFITGGPWNVVLYGFAGIIAVDDFPSLSSIPDATVERDARVKTSLNLATTQVGARALAWDDFQVNGSSNTSVAILDSGINASHEAFGGTGYEELNWNNSIIGWEDFVNSETTPYDDEGHGTFISGVIGSQGTTQLVGESLHAFVNKNVSHLEVFPEGKFFGADEVKIATLELTHTPDELIINTSYSVAVYSGAINYVGFILRNSIGTQNSTHNTAQNQNFTLEDPTPSNDFYDIYLNYSWGLNTNATFNVTLDFWWEGEYESSDGYQDLRGIAPGSKLLPLKVANSTGHGNVSNIISALEWIVANRSKFHIGVACLSLEDDDPIEFDADSLAIALNNTLNAGIFVVMAAGNGGISQEGVSPLNKMVLDERIIVVGATNNEDEVAYYSAQGKAFNETGSLKPDLVAPGGSLIPQRASVYGPDGLHANKTTIMTGTSISAALVAGALNLMIQVSASNWTAWNETLDAQRVKDFKALLLMTCTETNVGIPGAIKYREDNPYTSDIDEGLAANSPTFDEGGKDVHEGYGRLNVPAALEALNNSFDALTLWTGTLQSSAANPVGKHASAIRVTLEQYKCYNFTITQPFLGANFQLYLYRNCSDENGNPILLETSVANGFLSQTIYYCPPYEDQEYILVVKAITGSGAFIVDMEEMPNDWRPELSDIAIDSSSPATNNTYDSWTFQVNYTDADNNPPMYIRANITRDEGDFSQNFTLIQTSFTDINYTDGKAYSVTASFEKSGNYTVWVETSDGANITATSKTTWKFEVVDPPSYPFPYKLDFSKVNPAENWTLDEGWTLIHNVVDANGETHNYWHCSDFDAARVNWTYAQNLDANLYSPYVFVNDTTNPRLQLGLRVSLNTGDSFRIQIRTAAGGTWVTLALYNGPIQQDWFQEIFDLTGYLGERVQVRFRLVSDGNLDLFRNKGVIINDFQFREINNTKAPTFNEPANGYVTPESGVLYDTFQVQALYSHPNRISPTSISVEVNDIEYPMFNIEGDWDCDTGQGVLYAAQIIIDAPGVPELLFRASDGNNSIETTITGGPSVSSLVPVQSFPWSSNLSNPDISDYKITGIPTKWDNHEWLEETVGWSHFIGTSASTSYFYCAEVTDNPGTASYGENWDTSLILPTVKLNSPHQCYLMFTHSIYVDQVQGDYGIVEISKDNGINWKEIQRFGNNNQTGLNLDFHAIDIADYNNYNVTVRFRFISDGYSAVSTLPGAGWKIRNITLGAFAELEKPTITLNGLENKTVVRGEVLLNFTLADNVAVNPDRVFLFIDNKVVEIKATNSSLIYRWDTWTVRNGNISIRLVVEDMSGNEATLDLEFTVDNPLVDYELLAFWLVFVACVIVATYLVYHFVYVRGQEKKEEERKMKERLMDAHNILPSMTTRIEQIDNILSQYSPEIENKMPFVLYCKKCRTWFRNDAFEWICPKCNSDALFVAKKCIVCDKWYFFDGPGTYYCTTGGCNRILIRDPEMLDQFIVTSPETSTPVEDEPSGIPGDDPNGSDQVGSEQPK